MYFWFLPSRIAFLARFANYKVENVSWFDVIDGEIQTIKLILSAPLREDYKTLVSFEFLNGMWVLYFSIKADMQCPKQDKLPFIHVNSCILNSLSSWEISCGILNFSLPARSTILNLNVKSKLNTVDSTNVPSISYYKFI